MNSHYKMTTNKSLPSKLYKYQSYNTQTLDNLKNRHLWFSKPARFNDPFDCGISFSSENITDDVWKFLYEGVKAQWEVGQNQEQKKLAETYFQGDEPDEKFKSEFSKFSFKQSLQTEIQPRGIACFSERVDEILMWSHYANGHRGFCLEFDTSFDPFLKAVDVNYSQKLPPLQKADIGLDLLMILARTKSVGWSYEKEWRVFHEEGDKEYGIDFAALTSIYFGCEMPFTHREVISLIVQGSPTKLYRMKISETEFKVVPQLIEYTPYDYGKKLTNK